MSRISDTIREYVNDPYVSDHYGEWGILRADQRRQIRQLCDACDGFEKAADAFQVKIETAKAEAVKEFAERLKASFPDRNDPRCTADDVFTLNYIDDLVEEMTEGG